MRLSIKIAIGSCVALIVISLFGWVLFPALIKYKLKKNLKPGTDLRRLWTNVPFPVDFQVYIFNVTNAKDVHDNGATPILNQIGPYVFEWWKRKVNVADNESEDTISFNPYPKFIFDPKRSAGLTMDEIVTIPHPLLTGILLTTKREKPVMVGLVGKAVTEIFGGPESIFVPVRVRDFLFDGLLVNCSAQSFGAKLVCSSIRENPKELIKVNNNEYLFSMFGSKNNTIQPRITFRRGIRNPKDIGQFVEWNNMTKMNAWSTDKCNALRGSDGTLFPAFLKRNEGLLAFAPELCRSIRAYYVEDTNYMGLKTWRYEATLGDMTNNEEDKCFCSPTCLKKGVMDLYKCTGAPVIVSSPHFYDCDPSFLKGVRGLEPDAEKHQTYAIVEPITGTPVSGRRLLQFNLPLESLPKTELMKNLPEVLLPLIWVSEGADLSAGIINQIDKQLFLPLRIVEGIKWTVIALSLLGLAISAVVYYQYERSSSAVAPSYRFPKVLQTVPPEASKSGQVQPNSISTISS